MIYILSPKKFSCPFAPTKSCRAEDSINNNRVDTMSSRSGLRILLIGRGGRESAIAWKLSQSAHVERIFVVTGNGGTAAGMDKVSNIECASEDDYPGLVKIAEELKINLVVPGPDIPVVGGIEGYFRAGTYFPHNHFYKNQS